MHLCHEELRTRARLRVWKLRTKSGSMLMLLTYPHEDQHFGVADAVFALGHAHHRELGRTGAFLHQIAHL